MYTPRRYPNGHVGGACEGHTFPIARVQAMHEGKRRARARRDQG
ncbi:hypothetical protein [Actinomadura physcomitrii]|nr:hypothetical protein [Actinomadura physcomitrii]